MTDLRRTPGTGRAARVVLAVLCAAVLAATARPARAQPPDGGGGGPAGASQGGSPPPRVTAGWRDGFYVQSENGDFRLQLGTLIQADGRFAPGDDAGAVTNTFVMRRLRPTLRGRFAERFEIVLAPDFSGGRVTVQDAHIDTVFAPSVRLRAGKAKTPFGLERLQSAAHMLFFERALPSAIAPNRDVGVQVLGDIRGGLVSYQAGILNGVADGGSADADSGDSKDLAGRLVVRPFLRQPSGVLRGLGLGIAGSRGRQTGTEALPTFRTAALQRPYYSYADAAADGVRLRYSPQLSYQHKSFAAFAEYVHSQVPVRRAAVLETISHDAWQVAASVVLTGEPATDGNAAVRPRANVNFGAGHIGAVQIAARYHTLRVDGRAFTLGLAAPGASRTAEALTLGMNWFLTPNFKYVVNVERTVFDGDAPAARRPESAVVFRTQVSF